MKEEIKNLWVKELPNYRQGFGTLHYGESFCCLGVLCDLAVKAKVIRPPTLPSIDDLNYKYGEEEERTFLPRKVMDWAGMKTSEGKISFRAVSSLAMLNDKGETFERIAQVIEKEWRML